VEVAVGVGQGGGDEKLALGHLEARPLGEGDDFRSCRMR
jgi:hypothetical protein